MMKVSDLEQLKALVEEGLDLEELSYKGFSPAHFVDFGNNQEIATYLIGVGARIDLHAVSRLGRTDLAKEMLSEANINSEYATHEPRDKAHSLLPIHWACQTGQVETVEILIQNGSLVDPTDAFGSTPLRYAVDGRIVSSSWQPDEADRLRICKSLVKHGSDVRFTSKEGKTLVDLARKRKRAMIEGYLKTL